MPVALYRPALSPYASMCRLSTLHERAAASEAVERMVDAGMSHAAAAVAARRGMHLVTAAAPSRGRTA
jgi:hypothetical protein